MAQIKVDIAGKDYALACAAGDEDRLAELAAYVDAKARHLQEKLGQIAENRLLLMTAILIADELKDAAEHGGGPISLAGMSDEQVADVIEQIASDVEGIAEILRSA